MDFKKLVVVAGIAVAYALKSELSAAEPIVFNVGPVIMQPGVSTYQSDEPNGFDLQRFEEVNFTGTVTNISATSIALWSMRIDYSIPTGGSTFNPYFPTIVLLPQESKNFNYEVTIPYTPTFVLVDMRLSVSPVQVSGTLTHVSVPECSPVALSMTAIFLAFGIWSRRASVGKR